MNNKVNKVRWIICHHTAVSRKTQPTQFWPINNYHKQKWNFKSVLGLYGGYHYLIELDGQIKQYRKETEESAACKGMNTSSVNIALSGNFSEELPTEAQRTALRGLLVDLMRKYEIPLKRIVGHRFFSRTECPGKLLSDDWARKLAIPELLKCDDRQLKIKLLKINIGLIEKIIGLYVKFLERFLKNQKADNN